MKSMGKKALYCVFVGLLMSSVLNAAPKKKNSKDIYKNIVKEKDPATKKVYDFKGMNVIMGDWWSDPNALPASKYQEDQAAFRKWTTDTYKFSVVQKAAASWQNQPQFVANYCLTGGDENYIFCIDGRSALVGVKTDFFYDLSKIKSVNYKNAKVYDQSVVNLLQKGNSFYAFNFGVPEPREGIFFNKRILEEGGYNPEYPYDLQKEGKWTWETFEEMCKNLTRDTDNDGVVDQFAMSSFYTCFTAAALDSNGSCKIARDSNGKYINNTGADKSMEAYNWIQYFFQTYQLPQPENAAWDYFLTAFLNGETAFMCHQEFLAQPNGTLSRMSDDWGFVAFPLGPSGDGVYRTLHDTPMWVIPNIYDAEKTEKIAKIIDLYNQPTPGYDDPDSWKETYYPGFRDLRAVDETLTIMAATPNARYDKLIPGLTEEEMCNSICWGWQTPQEAYETTKNLIDSLLKDANR